MRPIQFSALKAFDPLDQEPEGGEYHDRQPDIDEVEHGALLGSPRCRATRPAARLGGWGAAGGPDAGPCLVAVRREALTFLSETPQYARKARPNRTHARRCGFLTGPMQALRQFGCHPTLTSNFHDKYL